MLGGTDFTSFKFVMKEGVMEAGKHQACFNQLRDFYSGYDRFSDYCHLYDDQGNEFDEEKGSAGCSCSSSTYKLKKNYLVKSVIYLKRNERMKELSN